jgi:hypothetical protein
MNDNPFLSVFNFFKRISIIIFANAVHQAKHHLSFFLFTIDCRAKITRNEAEFWTKEAEKTSCDHGKQGKNIRFQKQDKTAEQMTTSF